MIKSFELEFEKGMSESINFTSGYFWEKGWARNEEVRLGGRRGKTVVTGCHTAKDKNLQFWSRRVTLRCYIFLYIFSVLNLIKMSNILKFTL